MQLTDRNLNYTLQIMSIGVNDGYENIRVRKAYGPDGISIVSLKVPWLNSSNIANQAIQHYWEENMCITRVHGSKMHL